MRDEVGVLPEPLSLEVNYRYLRELTRLLSAWGQVPGRILGVLSLRRR